MGVQDENSCGLVHIFGGAYLVQFVPMRQVLLEAFTVYAQCDLIAVGLRVGEWSIRKEAHSLSSSYLWIILSLNLVGSNNAI